MSYNIFTCITLSSKAQCQATATAERVGTRPALPREMKKPHCRSLLSQKMMDLGSFLLILYESADCTKCALVAHLVFSYPNILELWYEEFPLVLIKVI